MICTNRMYVVSRRRLKNVRFDYRLGAGRVFMCYLSIVLHAQIDNETVIARSNRYKT